MFVCLSSVCLSVRPVCFFFGLSSSPVGGGSLPFSCTAVHKQVFPKHFSEQASWSVTENKRKVQKSILWQKTPPTKKVISGKVSVWYTSRQLHPQRFLVLRSEFFKHTCQLFNWGLFPNWTCKMFISGQGIHLGRLLSLFAFNKGQRTFSCSHRNLCPHEPIQITCTKRTNFHLKNIFLSPKICTIQKLHFLKGSVEENRFGI